MGVRARAAEGIARAFYVTTTGRRIVILHAFVKKSDKTPRGALQTARNNEGREAMIKLATLKKRLMKNPKFRKEYEKADAEFSIVEALIHARTVAKLSQAEVARRIGTTQSAIARLEAGNTEPTIPTLRRYAEATGKKLRIELAG